MSDTNIDKNTGKISSQISGEFPKDGGINLNDYKDDEKALKEYLGKVPDSLSKQLEYMKIDKTVQRELVMIPYAVEVNTSYTRREEIIPPPPKNPEKP